MSVRNWSDHALSKAVSRSVLAGGVLTVFCPLSRPEAMSLSISIAPVPEPTVIVVIWSTAQSGGRGKPRFPEYPADMLETKLALDRPAAETWEQAFRVA